MKNVDEYQDFYLKRDTLLLANVFEDFMLLIAGRGIRGGICHSVNRYANANNKRKYTKKYSKNKKSSYLKY